MSAHHRTGGCQCGAVRFTVEALGRASICHCRMCQKASGSFFGPFVTALEGLAWTRGRPAYFQSSNLVRRGFCSACGTPLTFEPAQGPVELAIGAFDNPASIRPAIQLCLDSRLPWFAELPGLPTRTPEEAKRLEGFYAAVVSNQHPDHDT
jgi:hypothetical protein